MVGVLRSLELLQDTLAGEQESLSLPVSGHLLGRKSFSLWGRNGGGVGLLLLDGLAFPTARHGRDYIRRRPDSGLADRK